MKQSLILSEKKLSVCYSQFCLLDTVIDIKNHIVDSFLKSGFVFAC